tara:strand:- start:4266 stop:4643 length:378 start_codon:yes stop_codon:yes gene_type:complete
MLNCATDTSSAPKLARPHYDLLFQQTVFEVPFMTNPEHSSEKIHYICQTYVEVKTGRNGQTVLKIDKQFEYSSAQEAQNRAEREALSDDCAGADAYAIVEDQDSGEVADPSFLVRLGNVPGFDEF